MTMTDYELSESGVNTPSGRERPKRRSCTAEYKLGVLTEADACSERGEIGELLRREGLYKSHLTEWRRARRAGSLAGLESKKRVAAADKSQKAADREIGRLKRENAKLADDVARFKALSELAGKALALFETLSSGAASETKPTV